MRKHIGPPPADSRVIVERRGDVSMGWWWRIMTDGKTIATSAKSFRSSEEALEVGQVELKRRQQ
jgi:hypothetical protein